MNLTVYRICTILLFFAASLLSACRLPSRVTEVVPPPPPPEPPPPPPLYAWEGDQVPGALRMHIDLSEQKAQLYKGGRNVGWTMVATGVKKHKTPAGRFRITEKKVKKVSNKYGVIVNSAGQIIDDDAAVGRERIRAGCRFVPAPMPYWMRLTSYGIGMHAGHIPVPGQPASHGCIRLPAYMAQKIFENSVLGTRVIITP